MSVLVFLRYRTLERLACCSPNSVSSNRQEFIQFILPRYGSWIIFRRLYGRSGKQNYVLELTVFLSSGRSSVVLPKLIPRHVLFQGGEFLLQCLYLHDKDEGEVPSCCRNSLRVTYYSREKSSFCTVCICMIRTREKFRRVLETHSEARTIPGRKVPFVVTVEDEVCFRLRIWKSKEGLNELKIL
ncbi:hypothetical protein CDAR_242731 [Caerostris darwini]|uniref:Uncharacterized protein n=1 Tax=Caerostris darwini TaxID=1538125 RepID=A0AAV4TGI8_9ARAC|nr:hypothetical protein CDAR_242731 [Caerostris darwini]